MSSRNMQGGVPSIQFSSDKSLLNTWAANLSISVLGEQDMQSAYDRAGKFLRQQGNVLVEQHGWSSVHGSTLNLKNVKGDRVILPVLSKYFLRPWNDTWKKTFCNANRTFNASRAKIGSGDLFIDSPTPLANIFYLLQMLQPGMLLINCIDIDDANETETTRSLPRISWVRKHKATLIEVLGTERHERMLRAIQQGKGESYKVTERYESPQSEYDPRFEGSFSSFPMFEGPFDSLPMSWTMCHSDCDWCGRCAYDIEIISLLNQVIHQ